MRYQVLRPFGSGPCRKQIVTAVVRTPSGDTYEATNFCATPQPVCPRRGMPTGQGYELCRSVCHQPQHAERNALDLAGERARGATLEVTGHTYACEDCRAAASRAGIVRLLVEGQERSLSTGLEVAPRTEWRGGYYGVQQHRDLT